MIHTFQVVEKVLGILCSILVTIKDLRDTYRFLKPC